MKKTILFLLFLVAAVYAAPLFAENSEITFYVGGLRGDKFKVFAIKSRVHFRRGFDDSGFAKTILLVEPEQPFLGTVRLDALPYKNVDVKKFYPYGDVSFP